MSRPMKRLRRPGGSSQERGPFTVLRFHSVFLVGRCIVYVAGIWNFIKTQFNDFTF
jgi:hypothetical protein